MSIQEIRVPDLEGAEDVGVVEVYISAGDAVAKETPLISLESDKAVMDVPSPLAGTITELKVGEGDSVNSGDLIAAIETNDTIGTGAGDQAETAPAAPPDKEPETEKPTSESQESSPRTNMADSGQSAPSNSQAPGAQFHATPSVRAFARELGVDLGRISSASGPKGRVTRDDVLSLVKSVMSGSADSGTGPSGAFVLPPIPSDNYADYGPVETEALGRITKISGPHLHRNWVGIPHVTQFEEADITELEAFRQRINADSSKTGGNKISPLIFVIAATARALKEFPDFNSSLNPDGISLTRKKYIHMGIAVDTPDGLVVPVIRDADQKGINDLALELKELSAAAREGKLKADQLKGAGFTISSLGGIGGTYFTPIINAPQTAILGLSKSSTRPVWNGQEFVPRLILPFSVSYDHRVIDGAQGARFAVYLSELIGDLRRVLL